MSINPDKFYPFSECVPLVGKSISGIYRALDAEELTAVKIGRRSFITGEEILRFRASRPTIGRKPRKTELTPREQASA